MEINNTSSAMDIKNLPALNNKPLTGEPNNQSAINKPLNEQIKSSRDDVLSLSSEAVQRSQNTEQISFENGKPIGNSEDARVLVSQLISSMTNQPDMAFKAHSNLSAERAMTSLT